MRLLLDAHVSGRRIGAALRRRGHDVRAVDEERALDGASDEELLSLSAAERRVMVTFDVKDFAPLLRRWAEGGRSHTGCVLVAGFGHRDFGPLLRGLDLLIEQRPAQDDWVDYARWLHPLLLEEDER